jgi:hypothetical protein
VARPLRMQDQPQYATAGLVFLFFIYFYFLKLSYAPTTHARSASVRHCWSCFLFYFILFFTFKKVLFCLFIRSLLLV